MSPQMKALIAGLIWPLRLLAQRTQVTWDDSIVDFLEEAVRDPAKAASVLAIGRAGHESAAAAARTQSPSSAPESTQPSVPAGEIPPEPGGETRRPRRGG